jgi:hypothetical protein
LIMGSLMAAAMSSGTGVGPGVLRFCLAVFTVPPQAK